MIEAVAVTIPPIGFLAVLFGGGALFRKKDIEQDGEPPINRALFYASKYAVIAIWGAMVLGSFGIGFPLIDVPLLFQVIGLVLWFSGFALLYIGRFEMGGSFRLGTAKEQTDLRVDGLFRLSRNPMYVGMYTTVVASAVYTLNPVVIVLGAFVISVHHTIVLAEEEHMRNAFGGKYLEYCSRVGRYI